MFNALRDKAIAEKERESIHQEEEDDLDDPNTNLATLCELERAMELSSGSPLPFSAVRLPCVAHKESKTTNSHLQGVYIFV